MTRNSILKRCEEKGLRLTEQRKIIAQAITDSDDHPDVEELYKRASTIDSNISIATVYRTVKLFEKSGILERLDLRDSRARYEEAERDHHDHLVNVQNGEIIEFVSDEIEALQLRVAEQLGYQLVGYRMELYGMPLKKNIDE